MRIQEGKWSIYLSEDSDGHLGVWITHGEHWHTVWDHGSRPVETGEDIADGNEWGARFTTPQIEKEYEKGGRENERSSNQSPLETKGE